MAFIVNFLPKGDLTAEKVANIEAKMREFIEKKKDILQSISTT